MPEQLAMFPLESGLMPGAVVPLRLFEPRYLRMLDDALDSSRTFGVVLIRRGSEVGGGEERFDVGTAARIMGTRTIDDGTTLVIGRGLSRIRVDEWLADDPYPRAMITRLDEEPRQLDSSVRADIDAEFTRGLAMLAELGVDVGAARPLPSSDVDAVFQAVSMLPVQPLDRQRILEIDGLAARAGAALEMLRSANELTALRLASQ